MSPKDSSVLQKRSGRGNTEDNGEETRSESDNQVAASASSSGNKSSSNNNKRKKHHRWWKPAVEAALKGGASGSVAMVLQVILLMWLRTAVNYQYKHGVGASTALSRLYREGGILRFYRGASVALLTGPVARFGDTAANEGVRELFSQNERWPVWAVTLTASVVAALWRVAITPLDTLKTTLQVGGSASGIAAKIRRGGPGILWDGALGNSLATLVGHYPWFVVHNWLDANLPVPRPPPEGAKDPETKRYQRLLLLRRALMGFLSSVASDCVSNGIRVVKTYQQTAEVPVSYGRALAELWAAEGLGFAVRGLRLKIAANGLSGILFAVVWKMVLAHLNHRKQQQQQEQKEPTKPKKE